MNIIKHKLLNILMYDIIPFFGWLNVRKNQYCTVIYFHDIVEGEGYSLMRMSLDKFKHMMDYVSTNGYKTLRFDDLNDEDNLKYDRKTIIISFDDGWLSNYSGIFEYMKSKNIKYNVFLTVGEIDNNPEYLSWNQIREMHQSGIVGFGAHTFTHPDMSDLTKIDIQHEVVEANEVFTEQLGYKPLDFCYPFGYYTEESNLELEKTYKRLYTSANIYSYQQNDSIIFGRNGIGNEFPFRYLKRQLKGFMNVGDDFWEVYFRLRSKR